MRAAANLVMRVPRSTALMSMCSLMPADEGGVDGAQLARQLLGAGAADIMVLELHVLQ